MNKTIKKITIFSLSLGLIIPLQGRALYCNATNGGLNNECLATQENKKAQQTDFASLKESLGISAKSAFLIEANTGKVLFSYNENERLAPASMTKIMTLLLTAEAIEQGKIKLTDEVVVSTHAADQEGSKCFLDAGSTYLVKDLIKSVAVASANDSAVALSEFICGTEKEFAKRMNERAKELNMENTQFKNATGLDESGHYSTAKDLCIAIKELKKHTEILKGSNEWLYDMKHPSGRVTGLVNTNRLVRTEKNLILAKTGHTDNAGYCITTYSKNGNTEIIASVLGVNNSKDRFNEVKALTDYAFNNYETIKALNKEETEATIKVRGGNMEEVQVYPQKDVYFTKEKGGDNAIIKEVILNEEQYFAPLNLGQVVGQIKVSSLSGEEETVDLILAQEVDKITYKEITKKLISETIN